MTIFHKGEETMEATPVGSWYRIKKAWAYALKRQKGPVGLTLTGLGFVVGVYLLLNFPTASSAAVPSLLEGWLTFLERMVIVLTLLSTSFLWLFEIVRVWEESLPKKMTVTFKMKDIEDPVMICRDAFLSHEADLRAMAQQIGTQMAGGSFLEFEPNMETEPADVVMKCKNPYKHYKITYYLIHKPEIFGLNPGLEKILWRFNHDRGDFYKPCTVRGEDGSLESREWSVLKKPEKKKQG